MPLRSLRPPELLAHSNPNPATNTEVLTFGSDVYSFSLVLLHVSLSLCVSAIGSTYAGWKLVTNKEPYEPEGAFLTLIGKVIDENNPLRPTEQNYPLLDNSHRFCWPIMRECWKHSPEKRITSREAYERLRDSPPSPFPALN